MGHLSRGRAIAGLHGRYTIERSLSRGSGQTFLARDAQGGARVLTELHASDIRDWSEVERTIADARTQGDIAHPLIPRVVDLFATDGEIARAPTELTEAFVTRENSDRDSSTLLPSLVVVREFVEGESVEEAISRKRVFTREGLERFVRSLLEIARDVHALLPPGMRLRIAPETVVIDASDRVHVLGVHRVGASSVGGNDLRAIGELALALVSVAPDGASNGASMVSGLPPHVARVLAKLVSTSAATAFPSPAAALAALDRDRANPSTPSSKHARRRSLMVAMAVASSLALHVGVLLVGVRLGHRSASVVYVPASQLARNVRPPSSPHVEVAPASPPVPPPPPPKIIEWTGSVKEGPPPLREGEACSVSLSASDGAEECTLSIVCGHDRVADQVRADVCDLVEKSTPTGFAYQLSFAPRAGDVQPLIVKGDEAIVFPTKERPSKLTIHMDPWSVERETPMGIADHPVRFTATSAWTGIVVTADGNTPVRRGEGCTFAVEPIVDAENNCRGSVKCGDRVLYRGDERCSVVSGKSRNFSDPYVSVKDGNASVVWAEDRLLRVTDVTEQGPMTVDIYVDHEGPVRESEGE